MGEIECSCNGNSKWLCLFGRTNGRVHPAAGENIHPASTDDFVCEVCLDNYDTMIHKPYSLVPCGHTYCIECLNRIIRCPSCRIEFQDKIPNWEISRRLNPATAPSAPVKSKNSYAKKPSAPVQSDNSPAAARSSSAQSDSTPAAVQSSFGRVFGELFEYLDNHKDKGFIGLQAALVAFFLIISLIWPSAFAYVAVQHQSECFINSMIPIWMMISGFFSIGLVATLGAFCEFLILTKKGSRHYLTVTIFLVALFSLSLFLTVWLFVGTVWVFQAYSTVTYNPYDDLKNPIKTYCNPYMYKFAFGTLIVNWICVGIYFFSGVFLVVYD